MQPRAIHLYVGAMCAGAIVALAYQDWHNLFFLSRPDLYGFVALFILGLLSEASAFRFKVGSGAADSSIIFIPLLASILLFGPALTVAFYAGVGTFANIFVRRKEPVRAIFNISQYVLAAAAAGWLFQHTGGEAQVFVAGGESSSGFTRGQLVPYCVFTLTIIAVNHAAVAFAIALDEGRQFKQVLQATLGSSGAHAIHAVLISPIGILVAFLYAEVEIVGLLVSILPILFVRYAYVHVHRLQDANRDLLKALVKAIETRDPYTSGHSVRVQSLATRIGEELGLSHRRLEELKTAALLHDIGKIDVAYEEIIQKPGALSEEERRVIESHVTRGVDIVKSLSSFGSQTVNGIRHHHERYDGAGYPDGLKGEEIPLYSRIIHICDAVDAMLSDRPYRRALSLDAVREELLSNQGTQFDPEVVAVVVRGGILKEHAGELQDQRKEARLQEVLTPRA